MQLAMGIGLGLHRRQELTPEACWLPALEATGHGAPGAIPLRQIAPGSVGPKNPQDAMEDRAMVMGGAPSLRFLGWEQGLEPLPLAVGQFASVHVASPPFQVESIARRDQSLQTQPRSEIADY
jgi:hypothetical protein